MTATHPHTSLRALLLSLVAALLLTGCYSQAPQTPDAWDLSDKQIDSISFYTTHHYTQNYNFLVKADSLTILVQQPSEVLSGLPADSLCLRRGDRVVVADIVMMPQDEADSVWIKVARDQQTMGWLHEQRLLSGAAPVDPISRFIDFFSDAHLLIFLALIAVVAASYVLRLLMRRGAHIVHFRDIDSFFPLLLCLSVATSAVLYGTLQLFAPEAWRHFYYHPTLNPFELPWHLSCFMASVWVMVLLGLAAFDDVRRQLPFGEAVLYFMGLAGVCAVDYVVFSLSTLYYVGYPLLAAYAALSLWLYLRASHATHFCGNCGSPMSGPGVCQKCGADNS